MRHWGFFCSGPLFATGKGSPFCRHGLRFLLLGYLFYAIAAAASATRHFGNWYIEAGAAIRRLTGTDTSLLWTTFEANTMAHRGQEHKQTLDFYIMDYMLEESLELAAACFLLVGLLSIVDRHRRQGATPCVLHSDPDQVQT